MKRRFSNRCQYLSNKKGILRKNFSRELIGIYLLFVCLKIIRWYVWLYQINKVKVEQDSRGKSNNKWLGKWKRSCILSHDGRGRRTQPRSVVFTATNPVLVGGGWRRPTPPISSRVFHKWIQTFISLSFFLVWPG